MYSTNTDNKGLDWSNRKIRVLIITLYVIATILIALIIMLLLKSNDNGSGVIPGKITLEQSDSVDIQSELNKAVDAGMFNVFMNTNVVFESSKSEGYLLIQNDESNKMPVIVEIYTLEDEKLIYRSHEIPAGYKLEKGKLNMQLDTGDYECVAYFNVLDPSTKDVVNTIGLNISIKIK